MLNCHEDSNLFRPFCKKIVDDLEVTRTLQQVANVENIYTSSQQNLGLYPTPAHENSQPLYLCYHGINSVPHDTYRSCATIVTTPFCDIHYLYHLWFGMLSNWESAFLGQFSALHNTSLSHHQPSICNLINPAHINNNRDFI